MDLNHGPHPYQGCALTELSYGPRLESQEREIVSAFTGEPKLTNRVYSAIEIAPVGQ